jgi:hypothetical protein
MLVQFELARPSMEDELLDWLVAARVPIGEGDVETAVCDKASCKLWLNETRAAIFGNNVARFSGDDAIKAIKQLMRAMPSSVREEWELSASAHVQTALRGDITGARALRLLDAWLGLGCRNARITQYSPALMSLVRCNMAAYNYGSSIQARSAMFYMVKYITKDSVKLQASLSVLTRARKHVATWTSTAADAGTHERTAVHFLQRAANSLCFELSDTQAAAMLLGQTAHSTSEKFVWVHPWAVTKALCKAHGFDDADAFDGEAESDVEDDFGGVLDGDDDSVDADADDDDDAADDAGRRPTAQIGARADQEDDTNPMSACTTMRMYDVDGETIAVPDESFYIHRAPEFWKYNYQEFKAITQIKRKNETERKHFLAGKPSCRAGAGRPNNGIFELDAAHRLHGLWDIRLLSLFQMPKSVGAAPPTEPPDIRKGLAGAPWHKRRRKFAAYYNANFVPWLTATGPDGPGPATAARPPPIDPESFAVHLETLRAEAAVDWQRELADPGGPGCRTEAAPTAAQTIARGRLFMLGHHAHALTVDPEAKRAGEAWRHRNRQNWTEEELAKEAAKEASDSPATNVLKEALKEVKQLFDAQTAGELNPARIARQEGLVDGVNALLERSGLVPPAHDDTAAPGHPDRVGAIQRHLGKDSNGITPAGAQRCVARIVDAGKAPKTNKAVAAPTAAAEAAARVARLGTLW